MLLMLKTKEPSNFQYNKMQLEQSWSDSIFLLGPQIFVLPTAPDGLKTALPPISIIVVLIKILRR